MRRFQEHKIRTICLAKTKRPLRMTLQLSKLLLSAAGPLQARPHLQARARLQPRLRRRLRPPPLPELCGPRPCLRLRRRLLPPPLPELWAVHCNKHTGLQYAVPTRVRMHFGPPPFRGNLNIACDIVCNAACDVQVKRTMSYTIWKLRP